jgi:hypothetical protein
MPLQVNRSFKDGNTVPYGPILDSVRRNSGFTDLRGRPDLAEKIVEGASSPKLRELLIRLARERSYFSLGCDLGAHTEEEQPHTLRKMSGGYIQIAAINYAEASTAQYDGFCDTFSDELKQYAGKQAWTINLEGTYVQFNLPDELSVKAPSIWMWFFAAAKTHEKSTRLREELLWVIGEALHAYRVRQCLPHLPVRLQP